MKRAVERRTSTCYLPVLLSIIFIDEICNNHIIELFSEKTIIHLSPFQKGSFYAAFLLLQILAAPLQGGFSDFYCRKKSIIVSLSFSLLSLVFSFLFLDMIFSPLLILLITVALKSCLGNTLPLAWAGIADINSRNYRLSLGLSTSTIALGYLTLLGIDNLFEKKQAASMVILLYVIAIPFFCKFFTDLLDRKEIRNKVFSESHVKKPRGEFCVKHFFQLVFLEMKTIKKKFLGCKKFRLGLYGTFLPIEISFYSIHALGVDFLIKKFEFITIAMIVGYISGVLTLKFYERAKDETMIKKGYLISICSFLSVFLFYFLFPDREFKWVISFCYFGYSFGVAFIVPSLFASLSKEREVHEQGKIYGLIESTDAIALLVALLVGLFYYIFNDIIFINIFSFFLVLISRFFYSEFLRLKKSVF